MHEIAEELLRDVRIYVFRQAADTTRVPRAPKIAKVLGREIDKIKAALKQLAANKVLILAPNDGDIWAANPFCAVPSGFRVHAAGKTYWAICIWDALGIAAALRSNASIEATCGDCGEAMRLEVMNDGLSGAEGIVTPTTRKPENRSGPMIRRSIVHALISFAAMSSIAASHCTAARSNQAMGGSSHSRSVEPRP